MDRRDVLRALGLGTAATLLPAGLARGQVAAAMPKRVVFMTTQHGAPDYAPDGAPHYWKLGVPGVPDGADGERALGELSASQLSDVLRPLHPHREKVTVIEGLCMMSAMLDRVGNNHGVSRAHLLTCAPADYTHPYSTVGGIHPYAQTRSIDQHIAASVAEPGLLRSVEWGTGGRYGPGRGPVAYSTDDSGTWLPLEADPGRAFARVFPDGAPMPATPTRTPTRRELIAARRTSQLAFAAGQFERTMAGRGLSAEDRLRLEAHLDRVRDLEARLRPREADPTRMCDASFTPGGELMDQFFRLLAITFACDRTRVAALSFHQLANAEFTDRPGDVHQDFAHGTGPVSQGEMAKYYTHHAQQLARLLDELDSVIEPDGTTVLDNTMVIWLTELGTGQHDLMDGLVVVAGGGAGGLSPGRYVRFAANRPAPCRTYGCRRGAGVGLAHSRLFVSAMRFMGMSDDSFGEASGEALDGSRIDLSGPLPRL
ncbi:MAG: DUF1552 domain-containing protein [Sandaracinaceae bacterium]